MGGKHLSSFDKTQYDFISHCGQSFTWWWSWESSAKCKFAQITV